MNAPLAATSDRRRPVVQPETNADIPVPNEARGFAKVPNSILLRLQGKLHLVGLYAYLYSCAFPRGHCRLSLAQLSIACGRKERTTWAWVRALEEAGTIEVCRQAVGPNLIRVAEARWQKRAEMPEAPFAITCEPEAVNPVSNPLQTGQAATYRGGGEVEPPPPQDTTTTFDVTPDAALAPKPMHVTGTASGASPLVVVNDNANDAQPAPQRKAEYPSRPPDKQVREAMLEVGFEEKPVRKGRKSVDDVLWEFGTEACWRAVCEARGRRARNPAGLAYNAAEGYAKRIGYLPPRRRFDPKRLMSDGGDRGFIHEFIARARSGLQAGYARSQAIGQVDQRREVG